MLLLLPLGLSIFDMALILNAPHLFSLTTKKGNDVGVGAVFRPRDSRIDGYSAL